MEKLAALKKMMEDRAAKYEELGIRDADLNNKCKKNMAQLSKLESLVNRHNTGKQKIRQAEAKQVDHVASLGPLLERFNINVETAAPSVKFAEQLTTERAPTPVEQEQTGEENEESMFPVVSAEQMKAVPAYIKGRLTAGDLNAILKGLQTILLTKADLMSKKFQKLHPGEKNRVIKWREEDTSKWDGMMYVSEADLRVSLSDKSRLHLKNGLPALRHLHFIKELRTKGLLFITANQQ